MSEDELAELQETIAFMNRPGTWVSGLESIVSEMPAFMVELATTGGIATGVRKLSEEGIKELVRLVLTKEGRGTLKQLLRRQGNSLAGSALRHGAREALAGAAEGAARTSLFRRTATGLLEEAVRLIPSSLDNIALEFGRRYGTKGVYVEEGEDGKLAAVLEEGRAENIAQALRGAVAETYLANATERLGGFLKYAGLGKALRKAPGWQRAVNLAFVKKLRELNPTKSVAQLEAFMRRAYIGNLAEEYLEERVNDLASATYNGEKYHLPSLEQTTQELVAFAIPGGARAVANHRAERKVRRTRTEAAASHEGCARN